MKIYKVSVSNGSMYNNMDYYFDNKQDAETFRWFVEAAIRYDCHCMTPGAYSCSCREYYRTFEPSEPIDKYLLKRYSHDIECWEECLGMTEEGKMEKPFPTFDDESSDSSDSW